MGNNPLSTEKYINYTNIATYDDDEPIDLAIKLKKNDNTVNFKDYYI